MKLKEGFVLRKIAGDTVVIPSGDTLDFDMMITLNDTAAFLWENLEKGAEITELVDSLLAEYDVQPSVAEEHVSQFVTKLKEHGLLE